MSTFLSLACALCVGKWSVYLWGKWVAALFSSRTHTHFMNETTFLSQVPTRAGENESLSESKKKQEFVREIHRTGIYYAVRIHAKSIKISALFFVCFGLNSLFFSPKWKLFSCWDDQFWVSLVNEWLIKNKQTQTHVETIIPCYYIPSSARHHLPKKYAVVYL